MDDMMTIRIITNKTLRILNLKITIMNNKPIFKSYELLNRITEVYLSLLRFKLKNDCVCRIISELFGDASSVSILLYDASTNKNRLANYGQYLNPESSHAVFSNKKHYQILNKISVYEYFAYKYEANYSEADCNYDDFSNYSFFLSSKIKPQVISIEEFNAIRFSFFQIRNGKNVPVDYLEYYKIKKAIALNDNYELDNESTISSQYFNDLVKTSTALPFLLMPLSTEGNEKRKIFNVYHEHLDISISPISQYLAVPLKCSGRHIGLLRIHWHTSTDSTPDNKRNQEESVNNLLKSYSEEIIAFADIIARHIANSYPEYEFKKLQYKSKIPNYNDYCYSLSKAIQSKACIIRASENENSFPKILGYHGVPRSYIEDRLKNDHFINNASILNTVFSPAKLWRRDNGVVELLAIILDTGKTNVEHIQYAYINNKEHIGITDEYEDLKNNGKSLVLDIFSSETNSLIKELNLKQILLLKLPHNDNSYITFGNTSFKKFNLDDVKTVYPQINRLGAELKIKKSTAIQKQADLLSTILHEIDRPLMHCMTLANKLTLEIAELKRTNFDVELVNKTITGLKSVEITRSNRIELLLKFVTYTLGEYTRSTDFDKGDIDYNIIPAEMDLRVFLQHQITILKFWLWEEKRISINQNWDNGSLPLWVILNTTLLTGLVWNILYNAAKYSYNSEMLMQILGDQYIPGYYSNSIGHVQVDCYDNDQYFGFAITNWGKKIPDYDKENIFLKGYSVKESPDFKGIKSSGLGLYYSKEYANKLGAKLMLETEDIKTTFKVLWEKK